MLLEFWIFKSTIHSSNGFEQQRIELLFINKLADLLVCVTFWVMLWIIIMHVHCYQSLVWNEINNMMHFHVDEFKLIFLKIRPLIHDSIIANYTYWCVFDCSLWTWARVTWVETTAFPVYTWVMSATARRPVSGPRPAVCPPSTRPEVVPCRLQRPEMWTLFQIIGKVQMRGRKETQETYQSLCHLRHLIYQSSPHSKCPKRRITMFYYSVVDCLVL